MESAFYCYVFTLYFFTITTNFSVTSARINRELLNYNATTNTSFISGVGGGFYKMKDQQVVRIQSSNYGIDTYRSGEATVWRFFGNGCGVSASCPCFDMPNSFKCFGDYLKISDVPFYDQRFCGDTKPNGIYRSSSGHLRIRFRSDFGEEGRGFLCYVFCTTFGKADPPLPTAQCFTAAPPPNIIPGCLPSNSPDPDDTGVIGEGVPSPPIPGGDVNCTISFKKAPAKTVPRRQEQKVNWIPIAGRQSV